MFYPRCLLPGQTGKVLCPFALFALFARAYHAAAVRILGSTGVIARFFFFSCFSFEMFSTDDAGTPSTFGAFFFVFIDNYVQTISRSTFVFVADRHFANAFGGGFTRA